MRKHLKNYMKFHKLGPDDIVLCKKCGCQAVDLHHIKLKSQLGTDDTTNLIPVCRKCHDLLHGKD